MFCRALLPPQCSAAGSYLRSVLPRTPTSAVFCRAPLPPQCSGARPTDALAAQRGAAGAGGGAPSRPGRPVAPLPPGAVLVVLIYSESGAACWLHGTWAARQTPAAVPAAPRRCRAGLFAVDGASPPPAPPPALIWSRAAQPVSMQAPQAVPQGLFYIKRRKTIGNSIWPPGARSAVRSGEFRSVGRPGEPTRRTSAIQRPANQTSSAHKYLPTHILHARKHTTRRGGGGLYDDSIWLHNVVLWQLQGVY